MKQNMGWRESRPQLDLSVGKTGRWSLSTAGALSTYMRLWGTCFDRCKLAPGWAWWGTEVVANVLQGYFRRVLIKSYTYRKDADLNKWLSGQTTDWTIRLFHIMSNHSVSLLLSGVAFECITTDSSAAAGAWSSILKRKWWCIDLFFFFSPFFKFHFFN